MTLRELLDGFTSHAVPSLPVAGIACHSKQVKAGELFVAVRGPQPSRRNRGAAVHPH